MATCYRAVLMSNLCGVIAMQLKSLWRLFFTFLPKVPYLPASFLLKFQKDENFHPPVIELETAVGTLPELPQDVLMGIFAMFEIPDLLRAGAVCSSWRSAYTCLRDLGKYKQSQTPCLLYTSAAAGENVACLYSLVEKRAYKITMPEPPIRTRSLIGSSNGWLITADERSEMHLVNPITGEQIALPSVITIEHVKPIFDGSGTINQYELSFHTAEEVCWVQQHAPNELREYLYFKAFVFPDPSTESYIVVLIHHPYYQLSFARAGDEEWTWLPHGTEYSDCVYMDGLLYALKADGEIDAFDLTGPTVTMRVVIGSLKWIYESMYIIQAPWGDLLQVWRTVDKPSRLEWIDGVPEGEDENEGVLEGEDEDDDATEGEGEDDDATEGEGDDDDDPEKQQDIYCTLNIKVHKVDMEAKELVKIKSLPNHIFFLGRNNSHCLSADGHPKLKSNHAYFTDDGDQTITQVNYHPRDIGIWDFENSSKKEIVSQIWSNWPCPTWITPSLMKLNLAFSK
ncbi:unnamed protein product [Urochloa humidicola]